MSTWRARDWMVEAPPCTICPVERWYCPDCGTRMQHELESNCHFCISCWTERTLQNIRRAWEYAELMDRNQEAA